MSVLHASPARGRVPFVAHAAEFAEVTGPAPRLVRLVETDAHEGPVYCADEDALYVTTTRKPAGGTSIVRTDGSPPTSRPATSCR